jgi:hypothetical protein
MKNVILLLFLLINLNIFSQALYSGNVMFDSYLGFPNFGKSLIISGLSNQTNTTFKGLAPSGFRGEYLIDDNIGIGFDYMFNYADLKYKEIDTTWQNDQVNISYNDVHSIMRRNRFQIRLNYHIEHDNPRYDSYFGIGVGYNNRTYSSTRNQVDNTNEFMSRVQLIPFPISMRICMGGRFYFSQYVGLVAEVGLGGPLLSFGLALKY